jgi:pimeloyl-ACP methyl ester carboxylesterase
MLPYVPKIILEASEGRFVAAMQAVRPGWPEPYTIHHPWSEIVNCNEETPFYTSEDVRAAAAALPDIAALLPVEMMALDLCALGDFPAPPPVENEPLHSQVPTLLLSGEFDATTPPRYAEQAAATLDNAFVYTFPRATHATMFIGDCFFDVLLDFLDDPTTAPDISCLQERAKDFPWSATLPAVDS